MSNPEGFVTLKVSKRAHEALRNLKFEFRVENYPDVIEKLLEEHHEKKEEAR